MNKICGDLESRLQLDLDLAHKRLDLDQTNSIISEFNLNMWILQVAADEPDLIRIVRDFWLRWPSKKPYNLDAPEKEDYSMGQSLVVDSLLKHKVPNKFLSEYYLFLVTFPMAFKARVGFTLFALWR